MAEGLPHGLFSLLFPDDCRLCGAPLARFTRVPVCPGCIESLQPAPAVACPHCGGSLQGDPRTPERCPRCAAGVLPFEWVRAWGLYDGELQRLIHLVKYQGMEALARPLGERVAALANGAGPLDLVVPVPLHWRRRWSRGFNQSEWLAREVSRQIGAPLDRRCLRRRRDTPSQTGLTRPERQRNVENAFVVSKPESMAGKRIALVDDVVTTGATTGECARTLLRAGAARVVVLALARAVRQTDQSEESPAEASAEASKQRGAAC